jgi:nickel-dependent lactate racemase
MAATKISFPYGKQAFALDPSSLGDCHVFSPGNFEPEETEEEIVEKALANPVGSSPLPLLLKEKKPSKITVILSDITRVTGSSIFLPILQSILEEGKIPPKNITYLIASGIHPPCDEKQLESILGINPSSLLRLKEVAPPYRYALSNGSKVVQHNAKDKKELATMGRFSDGVPLRINKHAAESDLIILTGAITLHYLGGFGGGRKAVLPGISGYKDCLDLHKLSLCRKLDRKTERASLGNLRGNPFHQRMEEATEMMGPSFLLNTICDERKRVIFAVSGHWKKAFLKGTRFFREKFCLESRDLFDAAIVSCGGFPKDINFIQSHKAFENAIGLVREGGALLLLAECKGGVGNPTFLDWFRFGSEKDFVQALRKNFEINGQTALSTFLKCCRIRTYMATSLDGGILKKMGITKVTDIGEFAKREKLDKKKVALIPHGSVTWARWAGK